MTSKQEHWHSEVAHRTEHESRLRRRAERLSDRSVGFIVLSLSVVLLVAFSALLGSLVDNFLLGTTILGVIVGAAALLLRTRVH